MAVNPSNYCSGALSFNSFRINDDAAEEFGILDQAVVR
jgi:hypothetical protein